LQFTSVIAEAKPQESQDDTATGSSMQQCVNELLTELLTGRQGLLISTFPIVGIATSALSLTYSSQTS